MLMSIPGLPPLQEPKLPPRGPICPFSPNPLCQGLPPLLPRRLRNGFGPKHVLVRSSPGRRPFPPDGSNPFFHTPVFVHTPLGTRLFEPGLASPLIP